MIWKTQKSFFVIINIKWHKLKTCRVKFNRESSSWYVSRAWVLYDKPVTNLLGRSSIKIAILLLPEIKKTCDMKVYFIYFYYFFKSNNTEPCNDNIRRLNLSCSNSCKYKPPVLKHSSTQFRIPIGPTN